MPEFWVLQQANVACVLSAATALFGSALVSACAAIRSTQQDKAFGCALSAGVNLVAALHYGLIWREVLQKNPDEDKIYALRFGDWLVTLPPIVFEMYLLLGSAGVFEPQSGRPPTLSVWVAVAFQPIIVILGALSRWLPNAPLKIVFFLCSGAPFVVYIYFVLIAVDEQIADGDSNDSQSLVRYLCYVQIGYPLVYAAVSLLQIGTQEQKTENTQLLNESESTTRSERSGRVDSILFLSNLSYSILDVASKVVLALGMSLLSFEVSSTRA